jgi:hypothetical protein
MFGAELKMPTNPQGHAGGENVRKKLIPLVIVCGLLFLAVYHWLSLEPRRSVTDIPAAQMCPFEQCAVAETVAIHNGRIVAYYQNGWKEVWGMPLDKKNHPTCSMPSVVCPEGHMCSVDEECNLIEYIGNVGEVR